MKPTVLVFALLGLALAGCGDDGEYDSEAFCDDAETAAAPVDGSPTADEQLRALEDFAANAPDELDDDFTILVETFEAVAEVQGSTAALDSPELQDARENIEVYVAAECGVDLSPQSG